ncbi:MAG: PilZ domain-containing protein, partial [Myxococcota bacterium]
MSEKRAAERYKVPLVTLRIQSEDRFRARYLQDLSTGGVFIRSSEVFEIGTDVRLSISPPDEAMAFELAGRVVRIESEEEQPIGMGVEFDPEDTEGRKALERVLGTYGVTLNGEEEQPDGADLDQFENYVLEFHDEIERLEKLELEQRTLVGELLKEKTGLLECISVLESERDQMMGVLAKATEEGEAAKRELWELSADLAHVVAEAQNKTQTAEDARSQAEASAEKFATELVDSKAECIRLREAMAEMELQALNASREAESNELLKQRIEALEGEHSEITSLLWDANKKLRVQNKQIGHLRDRLSRATETENDLRAMLASVARSDDMVELPPRVLNISDDEDEELTLNPGLEGDAYIGGTNTDATPGFSESANDDTDEIHVEASEELPDSEPALESSPAGSESDEVPNSNAGLETEAESSAAALAEALNEESDPEPMVSHTPIELMAPEEEPTPVIVSDQGSEEDPGLYSEFVLTPPKAPTDELDLHAFQYLLESGAL